VNRHGKQHSAAEQRLDRSWTDDEMPTREFLTIKIEKSETANPGNWIIRLTYQKRAFSHYLLD
jgi:hypothetical protein